MPTALEVDQRAHATIVTLARDQQLVIRLHENPTTGYRWTLETHGELQLEADDTLPTGASPGSGAIRQLSLSAKAAGRSQLELTLRRAWEPRDTSIERFSLTVISA